MNFEIRFKKIPTETEPPVRNRVFLQRRYAAQLGSLYPFFQDLESRMLCLTLLRRLLIVCVLCYSFPVIAGFDEALTAYRNKEYPKAIEEARQAAATGDARAFFLLGGMYQGGLGVVASSTEAAGWYEKAAQGGVIGSFAKLAQMCARGDGVPKSTEKALSYARLSAQLGDPEGMFFLYSILKATSLGYLDANGKADNAKYQQLSARLLSERSLDIEAQDALYRSAEKGHPLAVLTLALALGGTVGENNRERILELTSKIPQHTYKPLQNYERIARHINGLGQSLTSPQLFFDAQASQIFAGMLKTCGMQENKDAIKATPPELTAITVAKPLSGATYLPTKVGGQERAYLVAGEWEEDWTYKGCDKIATVRVRFVADGLGGARFFSEQSGKDIPGLMKQ
jgi:TPR repeat protein